MCQGKFCWFSLLLILFISLSASGAEEDSKTPFTLGKDDDKLFLQAVVKDVYAIVGPLGNRSPENLGNNATFGFVVTTKGIVVIDPGGTYLGAKRIHDLIKSVSDSPIKYVINTGGQDHRWLGNGYFRKLGAKIIASKQAVADQKNRLKDIFFMLSNTAGEAALKGTVEAYADIQFDHKFSFTLGDKTLEIIHPTSAHSPGDAFVWLPKQKVVFTGDIVYLERLLSIMSFSNSKNWMKAFESMADLKPDYVVPGHGKPATIQEAKRDTYRYLSELRLKVSEFIDNGGEIHNVGKINQSQFNYLENYEQLKGRNIQQVYQEIEWE